MTRLALVLLLLPLTAAAKDGALEEAKAVVKDVLSVLGETKSLFGSFHLLPEYECGESRAFAVEKLVSKVKAQWPCAEVTPEHGETESRVVVTLGEGCKVAGITWSGAAAFVVSGGESRLEVTGDLTELQRDGHPLKTRLSYGTCGDEKRIGVVTEGRVPKTESTYRVDLRTGVRPGLPIIGSSALVLDGVVTLVSGEKSDATTFTKLEYKPGEILPKQGSLTVDTRGGHQAKVTFKKKFWRLGKATFELDGGRPVSIPVVR